MSNKEDDWVKYCDREDWADITPIEQDDGKNPLVAIDYSTQFVDVMNYFRGIYLTDERSLRALEITKEVIARNGASCSAWHYRWKCLQSLDTDLLQELDYLDDMGERYPKNYQLWWHRRLVVERLGQTVVERELEFTADALEDDTKNYHIWSYRQWLVRYFGLWDEDMKLVQKMIEDDVYNNSAWNQRRFVVTHGDQNMSNLAKLTASEFLYVSDMIRLAPLNEATWSYARALPSGGDSSSLERLVPLATETIGIHPTNIHALAVLADAAIERAEQSADPIERETSTTAALKVLQDLMKVDPMRERYWAWCSQTLESKIAGPT